MLPLIEKRIGQELQNFPEKFYDPSWTLQLWMNLIRIPCTDVYQRCDTYYFLTAFLDLINFQTASDNTHYTCISMYVCVNWMYVFLLINVDFYTVNVD